MVSCLGSLGLGIVLRDGVIALPGSTSLLVEVWRVHPAQGDVVDGFQVLGSERRVRPSWERHSLWGVGAQLGSVPLASALEEKRHVSAHINYTSD